MAQNITWMGATYTGVETLTLPATGGGTAKFIEEGEIVTYRTGTAAPSASLGVDGDIYLQLKG